MPAAFSTCNLPTPHATSEGRELSSLASPTCLPIDLGPDPSPRNQCPPDALVPVSYNSSQVPEHTPNHVASVSHHYMPSAYHSAVHTRPL